MTMASTLTEAANLTYAQLSLAWAASTLKTKLGAFITSCAAIFEDAVPNDRPVGNWLIPMKALQSNMSAGVLPQSEFNEAVDLVYRMCLAAASAQTSSLITGTQATAMRAAWNTQFGT